MVPGAHTVRPMAVWLWCYGDSSVLCLGQGLLWSFLSLNWSFGELFALDSSWNVRPLSPLGGCSLGNVPPFRSLSRQLPSPGRFLLPDAMFLFLCLFLLQCAWLLRQHEVQLGVTHPPGTQALAWCTALPAPLLPPMWGRCLVGLGGLVSPVCIITLLWVGATPPPCPGTSA